MALSLAVFSFLWVQKTRFSQWGQFIFTFSWSILVSHWLSISHNFQNGRWTLMSINNSNRDSHFWYEPSLPQWLVLISGAWASNAMCSFYMRSLLMQSKNELIVTRQAPNNFLCSKSISMDSGFWIVKMILYILPQLGSQYLCQLCLTLVMLRYVS